MGGRVSVARGPAGTTEASSLSTSPPTGKTPKRPPFNTRTLLVPLAALTLGTTFYIYTRTTVHAARETAKRHRDADGGSINWRNEGLRRHGALEKPEERTLWAQLFSGGEGEEAKARRVREARRLELLGREREQRGGNVIEEGIRRAREGRGNVGRDGEGGGDEREGG